MHQYSHRLYASVLRVPFANTVPQEQDSSGGPLSGGKDRGAAAETGTCHQMRARMSSQRRVNFGHEIGCECEAIT